MPYVQVSHTNYDTHNENFNFHLEQLAEFDTPFTLSADRPPGAWDAGIHTGRRDVRVRSNAAH